jgi:nucleoside-diphosphate-sugar epimerase
MTTPDVSEQAKPQTALITGATGFIGRHLMLHLVTLGWKVHALARKVSTDVDIANVATWHSYDGDYQSVSQAITASNPDVVFHLASLFLSEHKPEHIDALVDVNLRFGMHLLEAMHQHNVRRLINAGTSWQHYKNADYDPVNLYAATKHAFETVVDFYCNAHNLRSVNLKLHDTYGPKDTRTKILTLLLESAKSHAQLDLSPGYQKLILLHVEDVVEAFTLIARELLEARISIGNHKSYALNTGIYYSLRDIVAEIESLTNKKLNVNWGSRPYRNRDPLEPILKFNPPPGWEPKKNLREYLVTQLLEKNFCK